ncbi:MAG: hypothetical protein M3Z20_07225 [Chloroflexota bacterium]|nr:hypothetical protein [Chloroflexota bacterium]
MKTRTRMLALTLGFALITPGVALAQEATPTADCGAVAPRDERDLQALSGTPPAPVGTPASEPSPVATPFMMPEGDEASEEDMAAVTSVYRTLTDCVNTGDFLRVASLYTDQYLQRNFSPELIENLDQTPEPNQEAMQTEFLEVRDARYLDEDRLAALVVTSNPNTGELQTYVELVRSGDSWLIDYEQPLEVGDATPTS